MANIKDTKKKEVDDRSLITEDGTFSAFGVVPPTPAINENKKPIKK